MIAIVLDKSEKEIRAQLLKKDTRHCNRIWFITEDVTFSVEPAESSDKRLTVPRQFEGRPEKEIFVMGKSGPHAFDDSWEKRVLFVTGAHVL